VPFDKTFPAYIRPDQGSVDVHDLAGRNLGVQTSLDRAFEDLTESSFAPPLANVSQARVMRQFLVKAIPCEPTDGDVDLSLTHQLAVMHDAAQQAGEHQADRHLRIDTGSAVVNAIAVRNCFPQPRKIKSTINTSQHVVVRNDLSE
jgi:hypothetical protein